MTLEPLINASPAIKIHLATAVVALVLGILMWAQKKGTRRHKLIGRGFLAFLIVTALSSLFIREINNGSFSFIHLFVPLTLLGSWQAVTRIRRKNIKGHISAVKGMFFGALLIPGFLAFLPGRHLWMVVFGS